MGQQEKAASCYSAASLDLGIRATLGCDTKLLINNHSIPVDVDTQDLVICAVFYEHYARMVEVPAVTKACFTCGRICEWAAPGSSYALDRDRGSTFDYSVSHLDAEIGVRFEDHGKEPT